MSQFLTIITCVFLLTRRKTRTVDFYVRFRTSWSQTIHWQDLISLSTLDLELFPTQEPSMTSLRPCFHSD